MRFLGWLFRLFKKKKKEKFNLALFTVAALECAAKNQVEKNWDGQTTVFIFS